MSLNHRRVHKAANTGQLGRQPSSHPPGSALVPHWPPVPHATPSIWSLALEMLSLMTAGQSAAFSVPTANWWSLRPSLTSLTHPSLISCPCLLHVTELPDPLSQMTSVAHSGPKGILWCLLHYFRTEKKFWLENMVKQKPKKTPTLTLRSPESVLLSEDQIRPGFHYLSQIPQTAME